MAELHPNDASILALLAQHPNAPASKRRALVSLLGSEGKKIAAALKTSPAGRKKGAGSQANKTAQRFQEWAYGNRRQRFKKLHDDAGGGIGVNGIAVGDEQGSTIILGHYKKAAKRSIRPAGVNAKSRKLNKKR